MEKIPENCITKKEEEHTKPLTYQQATSYWKEVYRLVDLQMYSNSDSYRRCDKYWIDVSNNFCLVKHWVDGLFNVTIFIIVTLAIILIGRI